MSPPGNRLLGDAHRFNHRHGPSGTDHHRTGLVCAKIDPRPTKANLSVVKAQLQNDQAALANCEGDLRAQDPPESVTERTREIGLPMTIGGRIHVCCNSSPERRFSAGGIAGIITGVVFSLSLPVPTGWPASLKA